MMTKLKFQYTLEQWVANEVGDKTRFGQKLAKGIADVVAEILSRLGDWRNALQAFYTPMSSESLAYRWLHIYLIPELAYARVEITSAGNVRK